MQSQSDCCGIPSALCLTWSDRIQEGFVGLPSFTRAVYEKCKETEEGITPLHVMNIDCSGVLNRQVLCLINKDTEVVHFFPAIHVKCDMIVVNTPPEFVSASLKTVVESVPLEEFLRLYLVVLTAKEDGDPLCVLTPVPISGSFEEGLKDLTATRVNIIDKDDDVDSEMFFYGAHASGTGGLSDAAVVERRVE